MEWHFEKFIGNTAVYGICPNCHFNEAFGYLRLDGSGDIKIKKVYNFCPICGKPLKPSNEEVEIVWNERDWTEWLEEVTNE